jgi:hypothetical protein
MTCNKHPELKGLTMINYLKSVALVLSMLAVMPAMAEQARPPIADKVKAYRGTQGEKVWTLRVGERSANQALVQIDGIDHDWQLKIQKMDVDKTRTEEVRYSIGSGEKKIVVLTVRGGKGELRLPGEPQLIDVGYDGSLSEASSAGALLTDYLK